MTREELKEKIKTELSCKNYLEKAPKSGYLCPFKCGTGEGEHGTGAVTYYEDDNTFFCHKCGKIGDVIDLIIAKDDVDYNKALEIAAADLGISGNNTTSKPIIKAQKQVKQAKKEPLLDYSKYYIAKNKDINIAAAYLTKRGISIATANKYYLGYDNQWQSPKAIREGKNPPKTERLIIPISKNHYIARATQPMAEYAKLNEIGNGKLCIFNQKELWKAGTLYICEGVFDALSIIELGYKAIALNSTANLKKLLQLIKDNKPKADLIISLDNDESGRAAAAELEEGLKAMGIDAKNINISGEYKDPNERLVTDKEGLAADLQKLAKPNSIASYINNRMAADIDELKKAGITKTGYDGLDEKAQGLFSGLYILAAPSSLGKTTFCHQMADQLAKAGKDVLYFSLEQSKLELASKSINRTLHTDIRDNDTETPADRKITSLDIRLGNFKGYDKQIEQAIKHYTDSIGDKLSIIEGGFDTRIDSIQRDIESYIKDNNVKPTVFIDYLQIIRPCKNFKGTTKEAIDDIITTLRKIARDNKITIIAISSLNRDGYTVEFDFKSLKESGGIEYTADTVWGLQFSAIKDKSKGKNNNGTNTDDLNELRAKPTREIDLICLKNRNGIGYYTCKFEYRPADDYFNTIDKKGLKNEGGQAPNNIATQVISG